MYYTRTTNTRSPSPTRLRGVRTAVLCTPWKSRTPASEVTDAMVKKKVRARNPRHAKWKRRPGERPGEILDAALRVFAARGYGATRLEDVAAAAGVTKGTIYYYFKNKEDILDRLVASRNQEVFADLKTLMGSITAVSYTHLRAHETRHE